MMKQYIKEFFRRGQMACSLGPFVLVVLYLILQQHINLQILTVREVCLGILSLSALAFLAGGMNVIYSIEQLPLISAILIHGSVLYIGYLATYLVNGWLEWGTGPILVFSGIFVLGFLGIWAVIYFINKQNAEKLNKILQQKQTTEKNP